jgi:hypothetical protein
VDVQLLDRDTDEELWLDVTVIHPMTGKNRKNEIKRTKQRLGSDSNTRALLGYSLEQARSNKLGIYAPLMLVASKQQADGKRPHAPAFHPVALSTFGEVGPGATQVKEWLAKRYKRKLDAEGKRPDGAKTATLLNKFRADFSMMLAEAVAHRIGAMAIASGLPGSSTKAHQLLETEQPAPLLPRRR